MHQRVEIERFLECARYYFAESKHLLLLLLIGPLSPIIRLQVDDIVNLRQGYCVFFWEEELIIIIIIIDR